MATESQWFTTSTRHSCSLSRQDPWKTSVSALKLPIPENSLHILITCEQVLFVDFSKRIVVCEKDTSALDRESWGRKGVLVRIMPDVIGFGRECFETFWDGGCLCLGLLSFRFETVLDQVHVEPWVFRSFCWSSRRVLPKSGGTQP